MSGVPAGLHICSQTQGGVENKVADALSRRVMTLVTMSTEVIGFERLREKYDSFPNFRKIYVTLRDGSVREMYICFYKTVIYSDSVRYVFAACPSGIFSWEVHAGGLVGHFAQNKTIEAVEHRFYWPV